METLEQQILKGSLGEDKGNPITVNLGNGQLLTFNTQEELSKSLQEALGSVRGEVTNLRSKLQEYETHPRESQYVTSDESSRSQEDKFNMDTYIQKMKANPVDAADYVDTFRQDKHKPTLDELSVMKQEYDVQKFRQAHPEFPGGQYADVLEKTRQELGLRFDKLGLETAYAHAVSENRIPNFQLHAALQNQQAQIANYLAQHNIQIPGIQEQQNNNVPRQQQYIQSQGGYNPGIPTLPRNQPQPQDDVLARAEELTLEQMETLLRKNGML